MLAAQAMGADAVIITGESLIEVFLSYFIILT
jgi:hypothetical protein